VTTVSEERDAAATPAALWRVVSDTRRWPDFYATPGEAGHLRAVEYLEGASADGPGVARRLHFTGLPSWDERVARWAPGEAVAWEGVRTPGQRRWAQHFEIIPGRGFATLRWEVRYDLKAPRVARRPFRRALEDLVVASLARVERLALEEPGSPIWAVPREL